MWLRLGFGASTGIDVAGEVNGLVNDPGIQPWRQIDLANGSFGQGVAVTPIQLATAYATLMNGGLQVQPHVVQAVGDRDVTEPPRQRLIDAGLSTTLVGMMAHVIHEVPFYRDRTLVPGYYVGGKTGTAQIWDPKMYDGHGAWKHNLFNYSFVGYIGRTAAPPGPAGRRAHRGGHADRRTGGPPRDAGHVVRAVPSHRDERDHDAGPAAGTPTTTLTASDR